MSRAAFTYKSKWQMKRMSVTRLAAYIKILEQRAKIGGFVTSPPKNNWRLRARSFRLGLQRHSMVMPNSAAQTDARGSAVLRKRRSARAAGCERQTAQSGET